MSRDDKASSRARPSPDAANGQTLTPGLYLVATPIGNLEDITLRALRVLRGCDAIACEDTRVSVKLLRAHGIARKPLLAYHDHNADEMRPRLLARMTAGEAVALISDAGTPLVSDPGFKLARDCAASGIAVVPVPGPSAVLAALCVSALPTDRFLFAGFLPSAPAARKTALRELAEVPATLVFFESPARLARSLSAMREILGDRPAAVARELTKMFEQTRHGTLSTLAARYEVEPDVKGEVVIVVGPPLAGSPESGVERLDDMLRLALKSKSLKEAVATVSAELGMPRRAVYARALVLKGRPDPSVAEKRDV